MPRTLTAGSISVASTPAITKLSPIATATLEALEIGPHGGRLYQTPTGTFEVFGAILDKYLAFGGPGSLLGLPQTNESPTPDGVGRFNHFQGGSIYWTPQTGAHVVYGDIRNRWEQLGWETSYLGYPISDEEAFDEGGRISVFQGGQVYWWPDTGAIDLKGVVVHYTGMVCFGETDWDQGSDSDEPYAIFALASPDGTWTARTRVYDDVDGGEARPDLSELYRGKAGGLVIDTRVMEHDEGNPDVYLDEVKKAVGLASTGVTALVALIPVFGPILSAGVGAGLAAAQPKIAGAVNKALDLGDDTLGTGAVTITPRAMVLLAARTGNTTFKGVGYKLESPLISGDGASYKVYFGVVPA